MSLVGTFPLLASIFGIMISLAVTYLPSPISLVSFINDAMGGAAIARWFWVALFVLSASASVLAIGHFLKAILSPSIDTLQWWGLAAHGHIMHASIALALLYTAIMLHVSTSLGGLHGIIIEITASMSTALYAVLSYALCMELLNRIRQRSKWTGLLFYISASIAVLSGLFPAYDNLFNVASNTLGVASGYENISGAMTVSIGASSFMVHCVTCRLDRD